MVDPDPDHVDARDSDIDWSKATFEGSRREQLRRTRAMSLRQRLEALDAMTDTALHFQQHSVRYAQASTEKALQAREPMKRYEPRAGRAFVELSGCSPTPLAGYLKALAILRLIAEAPEPHGGDPDVRGFWRDDRFVLETMRSREEIRRFFLEAYAPTPLVAPWNGGSGFYPKDNRTGIEAMANSQTPRLAAYREAISVASHAVAAPQFKESPKLEDKAGFIKRLRNLAPEGLLRWMDAAVILAGEDPRYPPLLGTGGNDGRLDFTNNFMQRLAELFDPQSGAVLPGSAEALDSALFAEPSRCLSDRAIGQFAPGSAGGPNATTDFEASAGINTWDFVLMLEGALLFGASAARRLESSEAGVLSAPFTVRSRAGTSGSASAADDGDARGEIWMPLWSAPFGLDELRSLLSEGRAALNGKPARDGLDFARAVAHLGVDRGISQFQRYGFLMRSGKAFLATPLDRIEVTRNVNADLIDNLDQQGWLSSVQRHAREDSAPNAFRSAARQLDTALFAMTRRADSHSVQTVLRCVGRIESALGLSVKSHEAVRTPAPQLSAKWLERADDRSAEFSIALALAGLSLRNEKGRILDYRMHRVGVGEPLYGNGNREWKPTSAHAVWGPGALTRNLASMLHRRRLDALSMQSERQTLQSYTGTRRRHLHAFLAGKTDDARIDDLLGGLACVNLYGVRMGGEAGRDAVLPPAFALLKLFFSSEAQLQRIAPAWLPEDRPLNTPAEIYSRLAVGQIAKAVEIAWSRLKAYDIKLPGRAPPVPVVSPQERTRWLAALCVPLSDSELRKLIATLPFESKLQSETNDAT
ncbi:MULTISPECIES: type I-U CRISPR-associated protein Csx17 [Hydrocarboniphaga]|jgi:CRISPR-associated protein Csx17|uniref:Type I-U CRISPR-associated protein Csx17 n=1 Tax=Hydrocarboniphaga effusa AP103 TaxID=1172194 RepID=I8TBV9_9GAMM|nr:MULTISPECIES: type I-U CRISPR-associated protein Csx17 [Hydrocarboniphaga]EIT71380.1 hypothetical protein WQQ_15170 [Hydrocarboniphaga effusa AP103]MDZ4077631.1 type I-U CRISPR-associated protein Csx17 [Hydrocarboniphaga sp.]